MAEHIPAARARMVSPRMVLISIVGYWIFYFVIVTARAAVMDYPGQADMLGRRAMVSLAGMAFTWLLYLALRPFDGATLRTRILAAFLASLPVSGAYSAANYVAFYVYDPFDDTMQKPGHGEEQEMSAAKMIAENALHWYFFVASWAALYLALSYAAEVRAAERRAGAYRAEAQAAQIRALRYQVNPHFLFNTLNSLSTLVLKDQRAEAEQMIMNLSTFFRTSLATDSAADVMLAEEIRLQRLYLDIEAVRFPDRMRVDIQIPPSLLPACVPSLILQPVVENAIKYGVSRTKRPVTIRIRAREEAGGLTLNVEDNGDLPPADAQHDGGTGVGLRNVRDRLAARFEDKGGCRWGPLTGGGFGVTLYMPLIRHGC